MFATTRFCYVMDVLFYIHYHYWGEENHVSYRGLCYIGVYNIKVPVLYQTVFSLLKE